MALIAWDRIPPKSRGGLDIPALAVALKALPSQIEQEDYATMLAVIEEINRPVIAAREAREKREKEREKAKEKADQKKWIDMQRQRLTNRGV